ncbi:MAG: ABC transporter permease [Deltaproteobacteria bacterium]|nr:ABC transporter permease [Deltaproteobacteria bacterium]
MHALRATIFKEGLILVKDKAGLGVILLMPVALLLVMTLVQQSAWQMTSQAEIRVLFLDEDQSPLSKAMAGALDRMEVFRLETAEPGTTRLQVEDAVATGTYKVGIVVPQSAGKAAHGRAMTFADAWMSGGGANTAVDPVDGSSPGEIMVYFDALLQPAFQSAIGASLRLFLAGVERDILLKALSGTPPGAGHKGDGEDPSGPETGMEGSKDGRGQHLLMVREAVPRMARSRLIPNAVQHNVPAWTLFGMFFIVVPLSGSMINERSLGVWARVLTLPVSPLVLLTGKVIFYLGVCLMQMGLMLLMGIFVLPLLGLPALQLGANLSLVLLLGVSSGLAAVGFGLLVGSIWSRQAPAAMFGAIFVVIMAALGGLMVPVFLMPKALQILSHFSPLGWGLEAFHDVFARGAGLRQVAGDLMMLVGFFVAGTMLSLVVLNRRSRQ